MELLTNPETWIALLTLTALEIVLGIDNIVFISIMAGKLPPGQRDRARVVGLAAAMIMRILLLFSISIIVSLTAPLFTIAGQEISGRDIILIGGGLFLIAKATFEIHERLEGEESHGPEFAPKAVSFWGVILQIMLLDIVFSLDSVITAVGMANDIIDHGRGHRHRGAGDAVRVGADQPAHRPPSKHQDPGAQLPAADRYRPRSRTASRSTSRRSTSTSRWASPSSSRR